MSPKTTPETPVRIDSEHAFREKVGLSWRDITLEWKKDQVLDTTEGALTSLREELSSSKNADEKRNTAEAFLRSQEKKEADTTLEWALGKAVWDKISDTLKKAIPVAAVTGMAAGAIALVDAKIAESGIQLPWKASVKNWLKEAMDENTAFLGFLWKALYKMFGWAAMGETSGPAEVGTDEKAQQEQEKKQKAISNGRIKVTIAWLQLFSPVVRSEPSYGENKNNIQQVFTYEEITSRKYSELKSIHDKYSIKNPNGIEKDLGIKPIDGMSPLTMYLALHLIVADERFLWLFHSKKPGTNWKDQPLGELLKIISTDMWSIQSLAKIKDPTELQKMFDESRDFFSFDNNEEKWELSAKLDALREKRKWYKEKITPKVLSDIFIDKWPLTAEIMQQRWYTEKEQEFIKELRIYAENLPTTIMSDPRVNLGLTSINTSFREKPLTSKEVFTLFLMTEGETSFDNLSWFSKFNIYRVLVKTLSDNWRSPTVAGEYKTALIQELLKDSAWINTKLPEDVRMAFSTITWGMRNMITDHLWNTFGQLGGAMKDPAVAAIVVAWVVGFMYIWRIALLSKAALMAVIWTILAMWTLGASAETRKKLEDVKKSLS